MIYEWRPSPDYRNYGDALGEIVLEAMNINYQEALDSNEVIYFPIGSVIQDGNLRPRIEEGTTPIFIGCGWYGEEISSVLAPLGSYIGARGPDTVAALERAGVKGVKVSGDSAYRAFEYLNLPLASVKDRKEKLLIPHLHDEQINPRLFARQVGVDELVEPKVVTREDTIEMTRRISKAKFVLAGAMHAAIAAHAHKTPFAPYGPDFWEKEDSRVKWEDWLEGVGISRTKLKFVSNYAEGVEWHKNVFGK